MPAPRRGHQVLLVIISCMPSINPCSFQIMGLTIQRGPRNFSKFWAVPIFLKSNVSRSFTKTVLSWHFVHVARRGRQGRRGEDLGPGARPPTHAPSLASTSSTAPPPVARIAAIPISPMAKSVWCALQTVSIDTLPVLKFLLCHGHLPGPLLFLHGRVTRVTCGTFFFRICYIFCVFCIFCILYIGTVNSTQTLLFFFAEG